MSPRKRSVTDAAEVTESSTELQRRVESLEAEVTRLRKELEKMAKIVRGNGETGLLHQVLLVTERVSHLQAQSRWVVGILASLVVLALSHLLLLRR